VEEAMFGVKVETCTGILSVWIISEDWRTLMVLASVTIHFGCAPQIGHATPTTQQKVQITRTFSRQVSQVETDTGMTPVLGLSRTFPRGARCYGNFALNYRSAIYPRYMLKLLRTTKSANSEDGHRWFVCDEESGFLYYGFRYYSPALGRWISRDPLEEQGGIHLFAFVLNHPINRIDTDGRDGDETSLLSTMGAGALLGCMNGAAISGAIGTFKHLVLNEGDWADVGKEMAEGALSGAVMGPIGKVAGEIQEWAGLGSGMKYERGVNP
jgi:RHS repeat-associated protein